MTQAASFHVLYLSAELPKQSETFVYREVLGLRRRGMKISIASVHAPRHDFGEQDVQALAAEALTIYPAGSLRLIIDAARSLGRLSGWKTLLSGIKDAIVEPDVPLTKRPKIIWQCLAGLALAHRVRMWRIDHLHSHMAHVPTTIAMYAAMALRIPFSFTGHAADLFRDRTMLAAKLRRASRVMCISHWHRRFYQGIASLDDDRLPLVRCGVDVNRWCPAANRSPDILAVGRLVAKKGFDVLIRSIARLRDEGIAVRCTIVGDGPQRKTLCGLVGELELTGHVQLPGALSNETIRRLMQEHGVFALPCRTDGEQDRDGIPVVLMEAMACGMAVVSGDLPTIRELISHRVSGMLAPPDDVQALSEVLRLLWSDAVLRERLGVAGRARVCDEFSLELNLDRLEFALQGDSGGQRNAASDQSAARVFKEACHGQPELLPDQPLPR